MPEDYDEDFGLSDASEPGRESAVGGEVTLDGTVDEMLENAGISQENQYDRFLYGEDNGSVKSALGSGYVMGARPEEDPRSF